MAKRTNLEISERDGSGFEIDLDLDTKFNKLQKLEDKNLQIVKPEDIPSHIKYQLELLTGEADFLETTPISKQQLDKLIKNTDILLSGYKSTTMLCSSKCMLIERCPLATIDRAPFQLGKIKENCPVELKLIETFYNDTIRSYADRHDKEIEEIEKDTFICKLISELAELHIYENRLLTKMADEGMTSEFVAGINNNGDVATNTDESPLFRMVKYVNSRRAQIYKILLLTPEMELKKKKSAANFNRMQREKDITDRAKRVLQEKTLFDYKNKELTRQPI